MFVNNAHNLPIVTSISRKAKSVYYDKSDANASIRHNNSKLIYNL